MKNQIKNLLRAGVFMLAAVFAFAFTQPLSSTTGFGAERDQDNQVVSWHQVDLINPQFGCDELVSVGCIYEQPSESSTMLRAGKFIP
jgi:hypothetical protein